MELEKVSKISFSLYLMDKVENGGSGKRKLYFCKMIKVPEQTEHYCLICSGLTIKIQRRCCGNAGLPITQEFDGKIGENAEYRLTMKYGYGYTIASSQPWEELESSFSDYRSLSASVSDSSILEVPGGVE